MWFFFKQLGHNLPKLIIDSLPQETFNRSNALTVRAHAQPCTEVPAFGPLNVHKGVQDQGLVKICLLPTVYWSTFAYRCPANY